MPRRGENRNQKPLNERPAKDAPHAAVRATPARSRTRSDPDYALFARSHSLREVRTRMDVPIDKRAQKGSRTLQVIRVAAERGRFERVSMRGRKRLQSFREGDSRHAIILAATGGQVRPSSQICRGGEYRWASGT
jgi:head-tail adaptor